MSSRRELRQSLKQQRNNLSVKFQRDTAAIIAEQAIWQTFYLSAMDIAFYIPFNGEASPLVLLDHARQNHKSTYLPTLKPHQKSLIFMHYTPDMTLIKNRYGIKEIIFNDENVFFPWRLDLVFVPLVGFDLHGNRLGMGGGYYDRTFAFTKHINKKTILCGLAYEFQKVNLPAPEPWDVTLDYVITEKTIYDFTADSAFGITKK